VGDTSRLQICNTGGASKGRLAATVLTMHDTETFFFALLASGLALFLVLIVGSLVLDRHDRLGFISQVRAVTVELAALVGVACVAGSLYLSEVIGFIPCRLCWVQRGFMYPAAVILAIAVFARKKYLLWAAGSLSIIGLPVSIYHRWEQSSGHANFCSVDNPCSIRYFTHFGFITTPTMAAIGFAGIAMFIGLNLFWRTSP